MVAVAAVGHLGSQPGDGMWTLFVDVVQIEDAGCEKQHQTRDWMESGMKVPIGQFSVNKLPYVS